MRQKFSSDIVYFFGKNFFGKMSLRICSYLLKPFTSNVRCLSFKSGISLDKIYPESVEVKPIELSVSKDGKFNGINLYNYFTLIVKFDYKTCFILLFLGYIPINELQVSYIRSSGAGGQHVQKLNTKCDLRFNVDQVTFISEETKKKMKTKVRCEIKKKFFNNHY